jgi:hypothetical protein
VRRWCSREDPFSTVWEQVRQQIEENPGQEAKTLFEWLQREYPGQYQDGQIRTLQRRIKLRGRSDCHMFEMPIIRAVHGELECYLNTVVWEVFATPFNVGGIPR